MTNLIVPSCTIKLISYFPIYSQVCCLHICLSSKYKNIDIKLDLNIPNSHFFTASQRITHGQNINGDLCNIFCHQYIKSIFEFIRILLFKLFGRMWCKFYTINLGFLHRRSQSCPLGCEFLYEFFHLLFPK